MKILQVMIALNTCNNEQFYINQIRSKRSSRVTLLLCNSALQAHCLTPIRTKLPFYRLSLWSFRPGRRPFQIVVHDELGEHELRLSDAIISSWARVFSIPKPAACLVRYCQPQVAWTYIKFDCDTLEAAHWYSVAPLSSPSPLRRRRNLYASNLVAFCNS
jgi:hypothetical protein